jgi:hypothetical protein
LPSMCRPKIRPNCAAVLALVQQHVQLSRTARSVAAAQVAAALALAAAEGGSRRRTSRPTAPKPIRRRTNWPRPLRSTWSTHSPRNAARAEVVALVGSATEAEALAEASVKETSRSVIRLRVSELKAEMDALNDWLEDPRGHFHGLMPTHTDRRWAVPWPAAAALLHNPEAALDVGAGSPALGAGEDHNREEEA